MLPFDFDGEGPLSMPLQVAKSCLTTADLRPTASSVAQKLFDLLSSETANTSSSASKSETPLELFVRQCNDRIQELKAIRKRTKGSMSSIISNQPARRLTKLPLDDLASLNKDMDAPTNYAIGAAYLWDLVEFQSSPNLVEVGMPLEGKYPELMIKVCRHD